MKTVSANYQTHSELALTTTCTCWLIVRRDGVTYGFTNHNKEFDYDGNTYKPIQGFNGSATVIKADSSIANSTITTFLEATRLGEDDILARRYDGADVYEFRINWKNTADGVLKVSRGSIGKISLDYPHAKIEVRGLMAQLTQVITKKIMPECQVIEFGEGRCGFDLSTVRQTGSVATITSQKEFTTSGIVYSADDEFNGGLLTWTSGNNDDIAMRIGDTVQSTSTLTLYLSAFLTIQVGDTFTLIPDCNRTRAQCKTNGQILNFDGSPDGAFIDGMVG